MDFHSKIMLQVTIQPVINFFGHERTYGKLKDFNNISCLTWLVAPEACLTHHAVPDALMRKEYYRF